MKWSKKIAIEYIVGMKDPLEQPGNNGGSPNIIKALMTTARAQKSAMIEPESVTEEPPAAGLEGESNEVG